MIGQKLMWTAVAVFIVAPVVPVPAGEVVAAVLVIIGIILVWLDK